MGINFTSSKRPWGLKPRPIHTSSFQLPHQAGYNPFPAALQGNSGCSVAGRSSIHLLDAVYVLEEFYSSCLGTCLVRLEDGWKAMKNRPKK